MRNNYKFRWMLVLILVLLGWIGAYAQSWDPTHTQGTFTLDNDVTVNHEITLTDDLTINVGSGHRIKKGNFRGALFTIPNGYTLTIKGAEGDTITIDGGIIYNTPNDARTQPVTSDEATHHGYAIHAKGNLVLEYVTIQNFWNVGAESRIQNLGHGGAIASDNATNTLKTIDLSNVLIRGCSALMGAALLGEGDDYHDCTFTNVTIKTCYVHGQWLTFDDNYHGDGMIRTMGGSKTSMILDGCEIYENRSTGTVRGLGGGITWLSGGRANSDAILTIKNHTKIHNNEATDMGGGIFLNGNVNLESAEIYENRSRDGGGIFMSSYTGDMEAYNGKGAHLEIGSDVYIYDNEATGIGGGLYMKIIASDDVGFNAANEPISPEFKLTIDGANIYGNEADKGAGIAIVDIAPKKHYNTTLHKWSKEYRRNVNITSGSIHDNTTTGSSQNGAGVYILKDKASDIDDGSIGYTYEQADGAGTLTVTAGGGNIFNNNAVQGNGGGFYIEDNMDNVEPYLSVCNVNVSGSNVYNNTAKDGAGFYVKNGTVTVDGGRIGLTADGTAAPNTATGNGGGFFIYNTNTGSITITDDAKVEYNTASKGGGVFVENGSVEISLGTHAAPEIKYNAASSDGGGIYANGGSSITYSGGNVTNNTAEHDGGGIYADDGSSITYSGGNVTNNTARNGGGIYANGGSITYSNGNVTNNTAAVNGGGICVVGSENSIGSITYTGGNVTDNEATTGHGGGMYIDGGSITYGGFAHVTKNTATNGNGGGIYLKDGTVNMPSGIIGGNTAELGNSAVNGGGFYITGNVIVTMLGEIRYNTATQDGGGIYFGSGDGDIDIKGNVKDNWAGHNGGGAYFEEREGIWVPDGANYIHNIAVNNGGGIYAEGGSLTFSNGNVTLNEALNGGGFYMNNSGNSSNSGTFTFEEGTLCNNKALGSGETGGFGGGIFNNGGVTNIKRGAIGDIGKPNTAVDGGGIYIADGGTLNTGTGGTCTISGNKASHQGGGIYMDGGTTNSTNTKVINNEAPSGGGGIYADNTDITYIGGEISNNKTGIAPFGSFHPGDIEDFEAGELGSGWSTSFTPDISWASGQLGCDPEWVIVSGDAHTGYYSIRGTCGYWTSTAECSLEFTKTTDAGVISFYRKVHTANRDACLIFIIDGVEMSRWKGNDEDWGLAAFPISAGTHTFIWQYFRESGFCGGDYALLDDIQFGADAPTPASAYGVTFTWGEGSGGGIYANGGTTTIKDGAKVNNNTATINGGGIYQNGGSLNIGALSTESCSVSKNKALGIDDPDEPGGNGGGVYVNVGTTTIYNSNISDNTAPVNGGGIYAEGGTTNVKDKAEVSGNTATINGGGIYIAAGGSLNTEKCTVSSNRALGDGETDGGGGIYIEQNTTTSMSLSTVSNNKAVSRGGGIYINQGTTTATGSTVSGNKCVDGGGGIYLNHGTFRYEGGAVTNNATECLVEYPEDSMKEDFETGDFSAFEWRHHGTNQWTIVSDEPHSGNYCAKSGYINNYTYCDLVITIDFPEDGGSVSFWIKVLGLHDDGLHFYIDDVPMGQWTGSNHYTDWSYHLFDNLTAGEHTLKWRFQGGHADTDCGNAWVDDIEFRPTVPGYIVEYSADGCGGGIYSDGCEVKLVGNGNGNVSVSRNLATISGGGIYATIGTDVDMTSTIVNSNTAKSGNGGGVCLNGSGELKTDKSEISSNWASLLGGGIYAEEGKTTITGSTVSGNVAINGGGAYLNGGDIDCTKSDFEDNIAANGTTNNSPQSIITENFESIGEFSNIGSYGFGDIGHWNFDATNNWQNHTEFNSNGWIVVDDSYSPASSYFPGVTPHSGSYSLIAGTDSATPQDNNNIQKDLVLTLNVPCEGVLNYYFKFFGQTFGQSSCKFYMDEVEVYRWTASTPCDWIQIGVCLSPGTHTFRWSYSSGSTQNGNYWNDIQSWVMIDDVQFSPMNLPSTDGRGGGIYSNGGDITYQEGNVNSNMAVIDGGGVYSIGGSHDYDEVIVSQNEANNGGGIYANGGDVKYDGGSVSSNTATMGHGGGFYLNNCATEIQGCLTDNNSSDNGDFSLTTYDFADSFENNFNNLWQEGDWKIDHHVFFDYGSTHQTFTAQEGYLFAYMGPVTVDNLEICGKDLSFTYTFPRECEVSFYYNTGGVNETPVKRYFYIDDVRYGTFTYAANSWRKASFVVPAGTHTLTWRYCVDFTGIQEYYTAPYTTRSYFFIDNLHFKSNDGTVSNTTVPEGHGGGIYADKGTIKYTNGSVSRNMSKNGSGGGIYANDAETTLKIDEGTLRIENNTASENGGGIYSNGKKTTITGVTIGGNEEANGNNAVNGGGIYVNEGTLECYNGAVVNNKATAGHGGGIYLNNCTTTIQNGSIGDNKALNFGVNAISNTQTLENFESGTWGSGWTGDWGFTTSEVQFGNYCLKSLEAVSSVIFTYEVPSDGNISFYYLASNDTDCPFSFYIDDVEKGTWWHGNPKHNILYGREWQQASIPVTAGTHTFRWTCQSNSKTDSKNYVCIDDIQFTNEAEPIIGGGHGGGIYAEGGETTITGSTVGGNTYENGNIASCDGGGIYVDEGYISCSNVTLSHNKASKGNGGGLYVHNGQAIIDKGNIEYNKANKVERTRGNGDNFFDDFEAGFTEHNWQFGGDADWTIDSVQAYTGIYCARSGYITQGGHTDLILETQFVTDGIFSFCFNVTSKDAEDCLEFYIDDERRDSWSSNFTNGGNTSWQPGWRRVYYSVLAGNHTFMWRYKLETAENIDQTCWAWIDNINFKTIEFEDNTPGTHGNGGGLYMDEGEITYTDGTVSSNTASANGGGIYVRSSSIEELAGINVSNNTATADGGGIYLSECDATISGSTIGGNADANGNTAVNGGGIFVNGGSVNYANGTVSHNTAAANGGGVYITGDQNGISVSESAFGYNKALGINPGNSENNFLEGFESGDFSTYDWQFSGYAPWVITSDEAHTGTYCAQAGFIDPHQESDLILSADFPADGTISFYFKTHADNGDGDLIFYIDGDWSTQTRWGPQYCNWTLKSFPITAGRHTFRWSYDKGYDLGKGVWVDDIQYTANTPAEGSELATSGNGGGIYAKADVALSEVMVEGNMAANNGGGIFIPNGVTVNMQLHNTFTGNHVSRLGHGGGIYHNGKLYLGDEHDDAVGKHWLMCVDNYAANNPDNWADSLNNIYLASSGKYVILKSEVSSKSDGTHYDTRMGFSVSPKITSFTIPVVNVENSTDEPWLNDLMSSNNPAIGAVFDDSRQRIAVHTRKDFKWFKKKFIYLTGCWTTVVNHDPNSDLTTYPLPDGVESHWTKVGDTYHIYTNYGLAWFSSLVNGLNRGDAAPLNTFDGPQRGLKAEMEADVDMGWLLWTPLGCVSNYDPNTSWYTETAGDAYTGEFEGNGYIINGIINGIVTGITRYGLFGAVGGNAVVKNTFLDNYNNFAMNTSLNYQMGGIAGLVTGGSIYNCEARGDMDLTDAGSGSNAGGLVGSLDGATLHSSMAMPTVEGTATMGGLVGYLTSGSTVSNCFANVKFTPSDDDAIIGGLVGNNQGTVENSYVRMRKKATEPNGFGWFGGAGNGSYKYCYAPEGKNNYGPGTTIGQGNYGATSLVNGKYGFGHHDQQITGGSEDYVVNGFIGADGQLTGLLYTLNNWVKDPNKGWDETLEKNTNGYSLWSRTLASPINDDYPVLEFNDFVCTSSIDGVFMEYDDDLNDKIDKFNSETGGGGSSSGSTVIDFEDESINDVEEFLTWTNNIDYNECYVLYGDILVPWTISSDNPHSGGFCMATGELLSLLDEEDNYSGASGIKATVNLEKAMYFSFYSRISTSYGEGSFFIDGYPQEMGSGWEYEWGETEWTENSFFLSEGQHELIWAFSTYYGDEGEGRYFIDDITFTEPNITSLIDFEDGQIPASWVQSFDDETNPENEESSWKVVSDDHHSGNNCMAAVITECDEDFENSQYVGMYITATIECETDGYISYWGRVDSEYYGSGYFYLDGEKQDLVCEYIEEHKGWYCYEEEPHEWTQHLFPVTTGTHELQWYFQLGERYYEYRDRYYVDDVAFISTEGGSGSGGGARVIYLYRSNPEEISSNTNSEASVYVYIAPDISVMQTAENVLNARVGVALDNSDGSIGIGGAPYDWHMFSSALQEAPMGLEYHSGINDSYWIRDHYDTYFTSGIPNEVYRDASKMGATKTTWSTSNIGYFPTDSPYGTWRGIPDTRGSFDFYCYSEAYCHWVNFKREGAPAETSSTGSDFYDHWHVEDNQDGNHENIPYANEESMIKARATWWPSARPPCS